MSQFTSYTVGFIGALVLTSLSFLLVLTHHTGIVVVVVLLVLAFIQLALQLHFFLHLGLSKEARWNTMMFGITFSTILLVVVAISWIMYHLNQNMMPSEIRQYITDQSSF